MGIFCDWSINASAKDPEVLKRFRSMVEADCRNMTEEGRQWIFDPDKDVWGNVDWDTEEGRGYF